MSGAEKKPGGIWNRGFISIFAASCVLYLGLNTMMSMIPKFASTMTDSAELVGLVSGAFAFAAFGMKILAGPATDTFNKKWIIFGASLLMAAAFFGFSLSNSVEMLIVFRLVQGTAQAFTAIALLAFASEFLPVEKMTSGIGIYSLGQTACQAIAPAFGLELAERFGYHAMCAICGGLVLVSSVMVLGIKNDFVRTKKLRITLRGIAVKEAMVPAVVMGLLVMAYSLVSSHLLIYAERMGVEGIGLFFTLNACVMLVSRPLIGRIADRYGAVKVMLPALALFCVSYFLISGETRLWVYLLAGALLGVGYGACQPLIQSLCIKSVGSELRGSASNTSYIGFDLGNMLGPIAAGKLADSFGYDFAWRAGALPVLAAAVILIFWRKRAAAIESGTVRK